MLYLHPRDEQRFRDAKLPTAGLEEGHPIVTHIEHQGDKDFARYELGCSK